MPFLYEDSKTIEDQLKEDFNSLCEWFIDNKLSIHFGEEKHNQFFLELNGFYTRENLLILGYGGTEIKQHTKVTYLGCILDNDLSGESMVTKVQGLINENKNSYAVSKNL